MQRSDVILIDSHSHLDVDAFAADRAEVVRRAHAAGVLRQIVPAIAESGWNNLRATCAEFPGIHPAYGLHPMYLAEHRPMHLALLREWIGRDWSQRERPVAVGECGLDHFVDGLDPDRQREYFHAQLEIARDAGLPAIVHARRAVDEVIAALRDTVTAGGVVHSFSGSQQQAEQLWRIGYCIGIGGPVTYERAARLRRIVATMPIEFLLLETDSPDQPGQGQRGQRNEPAHLREVLRTVAALRGEDEAAIAAATTRNAERVFKLPVLA
jgi:TatD DNase family protein